MTVETVLSILAAAGWLVAFLQWVAPRTATTADDEIVAVVEKARAWAFSMAPHFWSVVEWGAKTGGLPAGTTKATEFLLALRRAYQEQHGHDMPVEAQRVAETVAAGMSAAAKLPSPPSAPASR